MRLYQHLCLFCQLLVFGLLIPLPSMAQDDVIPDTLDWRGYYPLEVGNSLEWSTFILVSYHAKDVVEIRGDTLINGQHYYIEWHYKQEEDKLDSSFNASEFNRYVRYDTVRTRVVAWDPNAVAEIDITCDLSVDFGETAECTPGDSLYTNGDYDTDGHIQVGDSLAPSPARKYYSSLGGYHQFLHGIGRLPGIPEGAAGSIALNFVRVGSREYGESYHITSLDSDVSSPIHPSVYPNPASTRVTVDGGDMRVPLDVVVFDMLGRMVKNDRCNTRSCSVTIHELPTGVYLFRLSHGANNYKSIPLVVFR